MLNIVEIEFDWKTPMWRHISAACLYGVSYWYVHLNVFIWSILRTIVLFCWCNNNFYSLRLVWIFSLVLNERFLCVDIGLGKQAYRLCNELSSVCSWFEEVTRQQSKPNLKRDSYGKFQKSSVEGIKKRDAQYLYLWWFIFYRLALTNRVPPAPGLATFFRTG